MNFHVTFNSVPYELMGNDLQDILSDQSKTWKSMNSMVHIGEKTKWVSVDPLEYAWHSL